MKEINNLEPKNIKKITIPQKDEKLAELVGIILGDGNIYVRKGKNSNNYQFRIVGDSIKDKEYLVGYVKPLIEQLFSISPRVRKHKSFNALFVIVDYKKVVEFLLSIGMHAGNKIDNQATIPTWIFENDLFLKACIRGLVDTDGSIYELKPHWPGLWQICFTNKNETLLHDFRKALLKLGIGCSNIFNYKEGKKASKVYITRKAELSKFYKEIGFSNTKHSKKLQ